MTLTEQVEVFKKRVDDLKAGETKFKINLEYMCQELQAANSTTEKGRREWVSYKKQ